MFYIMFYSPWLLDSTTPGYILKELLGQYIFPLFQKDKILKLHSGAWVLYLPSPPFIKGPILYPGVHLTFLVSYSGEYQEMAFGMHLTHRPTRNIWSYESDPVSQRRFHSVCTAVFFAPPFFLHCCSLTTERLNISQKERNPNPISQKERLGVIFRVRGAQCTQHTWAHISVHLHINFEPRHILAPLF